MEKTLNKQMEQYFAISFKDVRQERSLTLLILLTDPDTLKQSKFTDHELNIINNVALEKLHCQKHLPDYFALQLLE